MSTFTEWNGPAAGRGPSTKDVLALIDAYNSLSTTLAKHVASTSSDDVHGFKAALDSAIADLESAVNSALAGKADSSGVASLAETVASNSKDIASEAERAQGVEESLAEAIAVENRRALKKELALDEAIDALETALDSFKETYLANSSQIEYDGDATTTITGIVSATEHFIGVMKIRRFYDIVEWRTFNAQYAGTGTSDATTGTNGVYILGRMSDEWIPDKGFEDKSAPKTARAHIKYINSRPFDLMVDMVATSAEEGSITCLASFEKPWTLDDPADAWEDMTLHLLTNTDATGHVHVFLAISAKGLSGQSTTFHVAGENFIPGGTVNGVSSRITFTRVKQGFNGNRANLDDLRIEALNDAYGKTILKVEYAKDILGIQHKDLYIADPSFQAIYFLKRPSVIFTPDTDDTDDTEDDGEEICPVLTSADLDGVSSGKALAGIIVFWPVWEEAEADGRTIKRAVNVPEGWLPCDGSVVSREDYPSLFEALGIEDDTWTLPIMDYAIIRVKTLFEDVSVDEETADLRVLTHKELTEAIINVQGTIEDETTARIEADNALQANIDAEEAARIAADEQLQANIDAEEAARIAADEQLQANIDAEEAARIAADEQLQANIDAEEAARIAADEQLQENIDAEAQARQDADLQLAEGLSIENKRALEAELKLSNRLDEEEAARIAADEQLQENIDAEEAARIAADEQLQENIDAEEAARIAADEQLQENIDAEEAARIAADEQLASDLAAETAARESADDTLQTNIDTEAALRQSADLQLQANIDTEAVARAAADSALSASISEVSSSLGTVASNVASLGSDLADEVNSRLAGDEALQEQIDELDEKKAESWTGSQAEFDAEKSSLSDGTIVLSEDELEDD